MQIRLGHSPDPDDAFMFWGLASGEVDPRKFEFEHVLRDIQTLNSWALDGRARGHRHLARRVPALQERYVLLPHGASMGSGYGPIVVSKKELGTADLRDIEILVPGELTTAFLVLRLCLSILPLPRGAVRPDQRGGSVRASRRGSPDPRGPAHVRE